MTLEPNPYKSPIAEEVRTAKPPRPLWVALGLWGLSSRTSALAFMWFSIATAIGGTIYSRYDPRFLGCAALLLAAAWYWGAIRWVDRHDDWNPKPRDSSN